MVDDGKPGAERQRRVAMRVLVVDDERDQRESLVALLTECGCHVDVAKDGYSAVRRAVSMRPDVVLMDLGMPSLDGWEATKLICVALRDERPYIIVLSAFDDASSRRRAFEVGCNEYIVKPFDVRSALRVFAERRSLPFWSVLQSSSGPERG
jgi:CheY-like chemotaxis protein